MASRATKQWNEHIALQTQCQVIPCIAIPEGYRLLYTERGLPTRDYYNLCTLDRILATYSIAMYVATGVASYSIL